MSESLTSVNFEFHTKPSGVPTHRPSPDRLGFVEWLNMGRTEPLINCHRLDKGTSGSIVFATDKATAAFLSETFAKRHVFKEYLFLSTKKSKEAHWTISKKKAGGAVAHPDQEEGGLESETEFARLSDKNSPYLYSARPKTGKTHQIRKHAVQSHIPILGDDEYGGGPFPRLMLHSHKLGFTLDGETQQHKSPGSILFFERELCLDKQLASWIVGIERRRVLFPDKMNSPECLRLLHKETGDLRIDQVGACWVMGWWKSVAPSEGELKKIDQLLQIFDQKQWIFQWRPGVHQKDQLEILKSSGIEEGQDWEFQESGLRYRASLSRGQNFGLFLDQRDRRAWVRSNSSAKRVLNLFAFSSGFSVNAAMGGAKQVVSVDLFAKYLDWGRENFSMNGLDPGADRFEFRKMDSMDYLSYARKKGFCFDVIVCDPPSFSRQKKSKKVFRIERDFKELLEACRQVLAPGGTLLFSTNYEKWDLEYWQRQLSREMPLFELSVSPSQWDYEWQASEANLKAFFLKSTCSKTQHEV